MSIRRSFSSRFSACIVSARSHIMRSSSAAMVSCAKFCPQFVSLCSSPFNQTAKSRQYLISSSHLLVWTDSNSARECMERRKRSSVLMMHLQCPGLHECRSFQRIRLFSSVTKVYERWHNVDRRARGKNVEGADSKQRRDTENVGQQNKEDLKEGTEIYAEQITNVDQEKAEYLLSVQSIRNRVPKFENEENGVKVNIDEIKAFEEWAAMKVKQEGPSVAPVIEGMRNSLLQRVKEASSTQVDIGSSSSVKTTELLKTMLTPVKLPVEQDPLAGITLRPIVIKRKSRLPENWDGPGGTVVLIDKPQGWSSFAVCNKLRHMLKVKKVGHAGTLDPLSTGLLIVCVGKATKLADSYQAMTKVYSGTMRLGETTPSLDVGTPVSETLPWEDIGEVDVQRALNSFIGDIMQIPPMYSAIKVKGERLYSKARRGEEIDVPARPITVYDFQLKKNPENRQDWDFFIICSKGTYIRSLCADLAKSLKSCAHLTALRREKIGNLSVKDAWSISELETHYKEVLRVPFQPEDAL